MSRDPYRSSAGDLGYSPRGNTQRWDADRFAAERERRPLYGERDVERYDERDVYERRTSRYDETRDRDPYYEPDYAREPLGRGGGRPRGQSITIEKEREYYRSPSPVRRAPARPAFLRRQSSLDTFDRKPLYREEYGPPARREDFFPARTQLPIPPPLPRLRQLGPPPTPRRYEQLDEIRIAEPDFYGDDDYRGFPERVREREIIRSRPARRSRSRGARSARSSSVASSSSGSSTAVSVRQPEFPKRGKTRMPAKLVSKKAIIDLGYPFEEEVDVIIIQKALGRENIDEVIRLSEEYKKTEMSGGRGTEIHETHREEVIEVPAYAHSHDPHEHIDIKKTTTITETAPGPHIIDAGPLVLLPASRKNESDIRAEIRALEAEKEALRAEKRADRELRRAERIRRGGEMTVYEERVVERREPEGGVRVEKDKKGPSARAIKAMLKTLT